MKCVGIFGWGKMGWEGKRAANEKSRENLTNHSHDRNFFITEWMKDGKTYNEAKEMYRRMMKGVDK